MSNLPVHSHLGASSYHRWRACPGSIREIKKAPPQVSSVYADEGTRAHEMAADWLTGKGPNAKNSTEYEMMEAVDVYVTYIKELCQAGKENQLLVEHRFDLSKLYPMLYGTADAVIWKPGIKELEVVDYKHGQGVPVDVVENEQLQYYALGALLSLPNLRVSEVKITIVQPRCFHVDGPIRSWSIPALELLDFAADLVDAAKATEKPDASLKSGDHCRFCPASAQCPELSKKALETAKEVFTPALSYDPQKLSDTLHALPQIESWIKSVREFAYNEANKGKCPPGWKLVAKRAMRRWMGEVTPELLNKNFGISVHQLVTEPELKSPAQVEKFCTKEQKTKLAKYMISESSGTTLVEEADGRPPVSSLEQAKNVFEVIGG